MRGIGYFISAGACAVGTVLSPDWRVLGVTLTLIFAALGGYCLKGDSADRERRAELLAMYKPPQPSEPGEADHHAPGD